MAQGGSWRGRFVGRALLSAAVLALASGLPTASEAASKRAAWAPSSNPERPYYPALPSFALPSDLSDGKAALSAPAASAPTRSAETSPATSTPDQALQLTIPQLKNLSLAPSLRFNDQGASSPYAARSAAPQDPRFNPTPGLRSSLDLGEVTVGTTLNRPLRTPNAHVTADGRPAIDQPNVGVDMTLKF